MKRVAVLVSGGGTNLQALIDASNRGDTPHVELALVCASKPNIFALDRAASANIPSVVLSPHAFSARNDYDNALVALLTEYAIDVVVLAGFLTILGAPVLSHYSDRIINVHPSLIPSFCGNGYYGLRPHEEALARGVKITGATVHLVNDITDGGRILLQQAVEVQENDTAETLQKRVMEQAEWVLLPKAVNTICAELE